MLRTSGISLVVGLITVAASVVLACGSDSGSADNPEGGSGGGGGAAAAGGSSAGGHAILPDGSAANAGYGASAGNGMNGDACAAISSNGQRLPLRMILLLDRSGSMCEYTDHAQPRDANNPNSKWQQLNGALTSFFSSPDSAGVIVSLIVFPATNHMCNPNSYSTPTADQVPLPDTTTLAAAMNAENPGTLDCDAQTPTRDALAGSITYATTVQQQIGNAGKVVIVMATDGYPQGCSDDQDIQPACNVAAAAAGSIPTYVIGVGALLDNLNQLAASGGTQQAFLVSTSNPAQVGTALLEALNQIRASNISCDYMLPAPPPGQQLELSTVFVQYTSGTNAPVTLPYDKDCTGPGWRFDDVNAPTKIQICDASCTQVMADPGAKIDLLVGCGDNGIIK